VLCPSTPFFLLSLLTFTTGMIKFYTMHKEDFWLGNGFLVLLVTILPSLDRRNILVSLQIIVPTCIWIISDLPLYYIIKEVKEALLKYNNIMA